MCILDPFFLSFFQNAGSQLCFRFFFFFKQGQVANNAATLTATTRCGLLNMADGHFLCRQLERPCARSTFSARWLLPLTLYFEYPSADCLGARLYCSCHNGDLLPRNNVFQIQLGPCPGSKVAKNSTPTPACLCVSKIRETRRLHKCNKHAVFCWRIKVSAARLT